MIPLLKNLGFIDQASVPTQAYKDYRDESQSKVVMAKQIKLGYAELFTAHEYANKLTKENLTGKLKTLLGVATTDPNLNSVVGTFLELVKLGDFETKESKKDIKEIAQDKKEPPKRDRETEIKLGLSYTINLNLPATTEVEVFNAIFKSLKENILDEE